MLQGYMLGLPFYSSVKCICMTASFHWEEKCGPIKNKINTNIFFMEVPVPGQESEQACICVSGKDFASLRFFYHIVLLTVPTVW
jgi:hypothetical protein